MALKSMDEGKSKNKAVLKGYPISNKVGVPKTNKPTPNND